MTFPCHLVRMWFSWHILNAAQLDVWDEHFICCSLFLLLSWYLLRVLKVTLASCSRAEWMPSNYPAQRLSLSTEFYDCCYVRKHVFQLYSQFNCLILCVKYKAQSVYFFMSYGYWDECPEGRNLLSTPPSYVSANTDVSVWTGLGVKWNLPLMMPQ